MATQNLEQRLLQRVRDIVDFPKPGVVFKDITPILKDPGLCSDVLNAFVEFGRDKAIDAVVGLEARGFLFGFMLANRLGVPFVPVRKKGKLPYATHSKTYDLEYGTATIEIHTDAFPASARVLVHDDLLATGGTISAATELIQEMGAEIAGYTFIIDLSFLGGKTRIEPVGAPILTLLEID